VTALLARKTRLTFETADTIRERGKLREVVVEAHPGYAVIRLKNTRKRFELSWGGMYQIAAKLEADNVRREKAAAKKAKGRR